MHQIFVGDKPIILTTKVEEETNFKNIPLKKAVMRNVIKILNKKDVESLTVISILGLIEHKNSNNELQS